MLCISLFECSFFQSDVVLSCVVFVRGHLGFVDYADDEAVVIQRELVSFSTVASVLRFGVIVVVKNFLVMVVDDAAHVRYATVAYFHIILVKDRVEMVVWWEVFLDQVDEGFSDVGLGIFAVLGVKAYDVSFTISFVGAVVFFLQQLRLSLNPLDLRALSQRGLALSNVSLLDDKADNLGLMVTGICLMPVGVGYDVKRLVIRFSVWLEESVRQVECNIEVVK